METKKRNYVMLRSKPFIDSAPPAICKEHKIEECEECMNTREGGVSDNAPRWIILEEGMIVDKVSLSSEDAQFLDDFQGQISYPVAEKGRPL